MGGKNTGSKLFRRAYDKAARYSKLTGEEHAELLKYLYPHPVRLVLCMKCQHPTRDKSREDRGYDHRVRICGPCVYGKTDFWKENMLAYL